MGKRKSSRKPVKRVVQKLDTRFNCLFCNHERSVSCTLDKKNCIGSLSCKTCGQSFQTRITALSQPVDVYSDWFDAVEEVNAGRVSDADSDDGSSSDYESDSDAEAAGPAAGVAASAGLDSDEEEIDSEDDMVAGGRRARGALMDSDDE